MSAATARASAFDLAGRVVLITGGAGLLGVEHAAAIAEAGGIPVIADVRGADAERAAQAVQDLYGATATGLELDVTSRASCEAALARVLALHGRLDGLVNNAALNPKVEGAGLAATRFENYSLELWNRELSVGLSGAFLCAQVFGAYMAAHGGGVIVNIASDLGLIAPDQRIYRRPGLAADEQPVKPVTYSVVKGGLVMLTKYLATYWADAGVRVNALVPGGVYAGQPEDFVERLTQLIPMGRMARKDEYRAALVFLCSDASSNRSSTGEGPAGNPMNSEILLLALDVDGVLTDGSVTITRSGEESKGIAFRDLDALARARRAGLRIALVTGEEGPLVMAIAAKAGAEFVLPAAKDKVAALEALSANAAVPLARICFLGDADRDAMAFPMVGMSLCPADGSRAARRSATRVLGAKGGAGAVEEAVEFLLGDGEEGDLRPGFENTLRRIAEDSIRAHEKLLIESMPTLAEIASVITRAFKAGRRIYFCGNGGSAADAQHVAAELVGRFALEREPFPALALTTDTSILTAVGNDWDFKDIFSRQVRAHARAGDIVVGISTSGKSANVVRALEVGRECGAVTMAFTGRNGGAVAKAADYSFKAPDAATPRVQELHLLAWHGICEVVEAAMVSKSELERTGT